MVGILLSIFSLKEEVTKVTLSWPMSSSLPYKSYFLVRNSKNIKGINIFDHLCLYTNYGDDTTFLLENKKSWRNLVKHLICFLLIPVENLILLNEKIVGWIPCMRWICGIQSIDLTRDTVKIFYFYFLYNKKLIDQKNYCETMSNIHGLWKLWQMRNFFIEGKILVFNTTAISNLAYFALLTVVPKLLLKLMTSLSTFSDSQQKILNSSPNIFTLKKQSKGGTT